METSIFKPETTWNLKRANEYNIEWYENRSIAVILKACLVDKVPCGYRHGRVHEPLYVPEYLNRGVKHFQPCPSNMAGIREWMAIRIWPGKTKLS